jgi:uncharacterized protein
MSQLFIPQVGAVMSADIAVPEHEREKQFYSRVLTTGETPLWREDLMSNIGAPIIGLGATNEQYAHLPLQWMPHIQVADVATSVQRATELGGAVLMHQKDKSDRSQWAVLSDPNGASFGVVPVTPAEMIPDLDEDDAPVGHIAWLDLTITNAASTAEFYKQVVGWSVQDLAMKHEAVDYADYLMQGANGKAVAGVCHARGVNAGLPPVWLIYLPVGDVDESLRRVAEEGGTVLRSIKGKDGAYVYAAIQDPVGAVFAIAPG